MATGPYPGFSIILDVVKFRILCKFRKEGSYNVVKPVGEGIFINGIHSQDCKGSNGWAFQILR